MVSVGHFRAILVKIGHFRVRLGYFVILEENKLIYDSLELNHGYYAIFYLSKLIIS